jgi:sugar phosphate isomerase/epimerase
MFLDHLPGGVHLTYCTNIHAGETWPEIRASLETHLPEIRSLIAGGGAMGVGLRLSGVAADALTDARTLDEFRAFLAREGLYVFTINAFPYGPFHGARVKEDVYQPDWLSLVRLAFTDTCADILASLLPEGGFGSISTVPGTFKPLGLKAGAPEMIAELLLRHVAHLVALERRTGKTIALALEPEPCCLLETADEAIAFFESFLLRRSSIGRLSSLTGLDEPHAEAAIRRHLGICYDVCHGAVEFEAPVAAMRKLVSSGIAIPKIQLSTAMRIAVIDDDLARELARFDEGTYLHQVVVRNGGDVERFLDLGEAFRAFRAGRARGEWRVHCHVPIFLPDGPGLGSTQPDLKETLAAVKRTAMAPHLEVETYTWDVLPEHLQCGSKVSAIARELAFVQEQLGR